MVQIDRVLIGDNPFNGVNHLSQEKAREGALGVEKISSVIKTAISSGASGLSFSVHPNMYNVLGNLKQEGYSGNFGVYPILPDASSNVRAASEKGMVGLLTDLFGKMDFGTKARSIIQGGLGALTMDPSRIMRTYIGAQVSIFMGAAPENARLRAVFLHEIITDLMVSFGLKDMMRDYMDHATDSLKAAPGFVTRNFARFAQFISSDRSLADREIVVMTPFNKAGFQMNPTRESCEEGLSKLPKAQFIAMSVLASGYLGLEEAAVYLKGLPRPLSCVVGVSTEEHARETFSYLDSKLKS